MNGKWTFAPYLRVERAAEAIDWYVRALGATIEERYEMPDGRIGHAELNLHGNLLCLAEPAHPPSTDAATDAPVMLYAIVPNVDEVFNRAIEAGARVQRAVADQDYGHRNGGFIDPFGFEWYISTPIKQQP